MAHMGSFQKCSQEGNSPQCDSALKPPTWQDSLETAAQLADCQRLVHLNKDLKVYGSSVAGPKLLASGSPWSIPSLLPE